MSTKSSPTKTASKSKPAAKAPAATPAKKAAAPAKAAASVETINLQTWITEIREENAEEFKDIPDEQMLAFIRNVFRQVCTCLEENNDGLIKVAGLGQFRISHTANEAKRITFRLPPPKQAGD